MPVYKIKIIIGLFLASMMLVVIHESFADEILTKIVYVSDGDTVYIIQDNHLIPVRLASIDAPEKTQTTGLEAKEHLQKIVQGKQVTIDVQGKDKYGRLIGTIKKDGENINEKMVVDGYAWHYKQHSKSTKMDNLEFVARIAKKGLWKETKPTPPWEYRHPSIKQKEKDVTKETSHKTIVEYDGSANSYTINGNSYKKPIDGYFNTHKKNDSHYSATHSSSSYDDINDSEKTVHVKGYTKKDGTYVAPYDRSRPGSRKK